LHVSALVALTLDDVLSAYEEKGVRFIPVREALEDPVYGIDPKVTWRGQENFLMQLLRATGRLHPRPPLPSGGCDTDCACCSTRTPSSSASCRCPCCCSMDCAPPGWSAGIILVPASFRGDEFALLADAIAQSVATFPRVSPIWSYS